MFYKKKKGFTRTEVIIVVIIFGFIGIVMTVVYVGVHFIAKVW